MEFRLGPGGQELAVGDGQLVLAVTPRHHLDRHATPLTVHASHPVGQEDHDPPERHELEPSFLQAIVGAAPSATARTADLPRQDISKSRPTRPWRQIKGKTLPVPISLHLKGNR